jgi:amino acid efflux transporter
MFSLLARLHRQFIARIRLQCGNFATKCQSFGLIMSCMDRSGLGIARGAALYVGAVLGPGVLLVPALAARAAGPASLLAWIGLLAVSLALAATFAALGVRLPVGGGAAAYVRAAYGRVPAAATGWWFLAGVVTGAPTVALIGGFYVAHLIGGGVPVAVATGAAMMATVLAANAGGLRVTATMQLGLAAALAALLLVAMVGALPEAHASNWTPFAPHGWLAVGTAANLLMLSFVGWEAVAHLAGDFADPARELPRAMLVAFAVVAALYLGLAITTVAVLGADTGSNVPLADLMQRGLGAPGRAATAVVAVLLTTGAMNAYVAGAGRLSRALADDGALPSWMARPYGPLALFGVTGGALLALLAAGVLDVEPLVRISATCFVAVYVGATAAGTRLLEGRLRAAAAVSLALVLVVLAFSGVYLAAPIALALIVSVGVAASPGSRARTGCRTASSDAGACPAPERAG